MEEKRQMFIPFTIFLLLNIVVSLFHMLGIVTLTKLKSKYIYGTQKYLIIALSLLILGVVALSTARESIFHAKRSRVDNTALCISLYHIIVFGSMYYFIMFAITIDRFLEVRLNIKYPLYWNMNKTKKTLILVSFMLNVAFAVLLCIILQYRQSLMVRNIHDKINKNVYIYFTPTIDTIFLISATAVYLYIFSKLRKTKRKEEALRKQVTGNETPLQRIHNIKKSRVPFWIIITFVLFNIVPNMLQLILYICSVSHEYFHVVYYGLYRIGYISNAIVYIFNLDKVRVKLSKLARLVLNRN